MPTTGIDPKSRERLHAADSITRIKREIAKLHESIVIRCDVHEEAFGDVAAAELLAAVRDCAERQAAERPMHVQGELF